MTNWGEIVNSIEAPKDMTPSEWMALGGPISKETPVTLGSSVEIFLAKYKITQLGPSQVALTLPAGISRIDFLKEAQELSIALHASNPEKYQAKQAISSFRLKEWESQLRFPEVFNKPVLFSIDCNFRDFTKEKILWRTECVVLKDLAVAHTAFYLLTGRDAFEGTIGLASDGALYINPHGNPHGLDVKSYSLKFRFSSPVSDSRYLPALS